VGYSVVSLSAMWCCRKFTSPDVLPITAILKGKPCDTRTVTYCIAQLCLLLLSFLCSLREDSNPPVYLAFHRCVICRNLNTDVFVCFYCYMPTCWLLARTHYTFHCVHFCVYINRASFLLHTSMRRITTFRSTTDRLYDGGPVRLYYNIIL
jgi:hypothetical protein